jgi:Family of unknown function (DUF5906)
METTVATASSLYALWSKDIAIVKREKVDIEWIRFLLNNPNIQKDEKIKLRAWLKQIVEGCYVDITYKLGKNCKAGDEMMGRLTALRGIGLQCFRCEIRNALAHRNYHDIDIQGAHPTLCAQLCKKKGFVHTFQDEFVRTRKEKVAELCDAMNITPEEAKLRLTALYFGGGCDGMPEFFQNLYNELAVVRPLIVNDTDLLPHLKFLNGKPNRMGKALAFILQTHERNCLMAMDNSLTAQGRMMDVFIHDGGLVRRKEGEECFPVDLLRKMEADVEKATGFKIVLVEKPMECVWSLDTEIENNVYNELKQKFENEEGVFSIKHPACWGRVVDGELHLMDTSDLMKNYETWRIEDEPFLPMWRRDANRREYEKLDFLPGMTAPPGVFNLFLGYAVQPEQNDDLVKRWVELIVNICNGNQEHADWLLNWCAHIFQKPYEKSGVAVVIKGQKGSGKDTPFDQFRSLLGTMYYNTSTPEKSIFSNFNKMMINNLVFKMEEATYKDNKTNEDPLKSFITSPTIDIQIKGKDQFCVRNYSRFLFTTNHDVPVVISDDERRYAFFETSDALRGNRAFWNETYAIFANPKFPSALLYYLLNRDIRTFDERDAPETEYSNSVKQAFIPSHALYIRDWIEKNDDAEELRVQAYSLLGKINEFNPKTTMTHRQLHDVMEKYYKNVITKTKPGNKVIYSFKPDEMRAHLIRLKWWIDV